MRDPHVNDRLLLAGEARLNRQLMAEAQQLDGARTGGVRVELVALAAPRPRRAQHQLAHLAVDRRCALGGRRGRLRVRVGAIAEQRARVAACFA